MTNDRRDLQEWYRGAMLERIDELLDIRPRLQGEGRGRAADELRKVGQALRGSGGTFGFPELSTLAGVVELTPDDQAMRRLEGLLSELRRFVGDKGGARARVFEWVAVAAGLSLDRAADLLEDAEDVEDAWTRVCREQGIAEAELAARIADHLGLGMVETARPSPAARRLLPEAFVASRGVVPLTEDSVSITVATAHPVSLGLDLEVRRLTGRKAVFVVASPGSVAKILSLMFDPARPHEGGAAGAGADHARAPAPEADGDGRPGRSAGPDGSQSAGPDERPEPDQEPLPARDPSAPSTGVGLGTSAPTTDAPRVLVVDDEESARLLVRTLLEKKGYSALEAADGMEALEVVRATEDLGVAVVDLKMPRMDGLELIWELRDTPRWAELPVIVVTGEQDEILEAQIMEEGADDYVRKPIDPRLFLARVEATLRRAEARGSG